MFIRPADLPDDCAGILAPDTSFDTDRIYQVRTTALSFDLVETTITPPLCEVFSLKDELGDDRLWQQGFVAEDEGAILGFAAVRYETWNRRAAIRHLYVAPAQRGRGVGRALLTAVTDDALSVEARCLWRETSDVNYPAIQFYRRMGFVLSGLQFSWSRYIKPRTSKVQRPPFWAALVR